MGIFDFIKHNKKSKSVKKENEYTDVNTSSNINEIDITLTANTSKIVNGNNEIILTEEEIQKYIHQEIEERISNESKLEFNLSDFDSLFKEAAKIIVESQQGSTSLLQKKLNLGYNRAGRIIYDLELTGIIGASDGLKARTINVPNIQQLECFFQFGKVKNERFSQFKKHFLPIHEELVTSKVNELIRDRKIFKENEIIKQEILDKENLKIDKEKKIQLKTQIRDELINEGVITNSAELELKREPIPQEVLDRVWNRDGGKCVMCGSKEKIEFDHIIPFSKGGSNTYRNIQILCEQCNRKKMNNIG